MHDEDVVDALGVMLDAARVQQHGARRLRPQLGRLADARRRDADQLLDGFGRVVLDRARAPRRSRWCARAMKSWSTPPSRITTCRMAFISADVAPGPDRQVEVGGAGDRREPRIDDDQPRAAIARAPDVVGGDRAALGDVRAEHQHAVGRGDVGPRIGGAVDAERLQVARRRRRPCRGGRCSRCGACRGRAAANLPIRYAFSLVSEAPESTAKASRP